MLEKNIEAKCKKYSEDKGALFFKFLSPWNNGVPDRILVLPGKTIYVEMKTPTGKLSMLQKNCIKQLVSLRQRVWIIASFSFFKELFDCALDGKFDKHFIVDPELKTCASIHEGIKC